MALILSIDLAFQKYENFGFCLLKEDAGRVVDIQYLSHHRLGLDGDPEAEPFADRMLNFCLDAGVSILMLDGSQGWKDPKNGLEDRRVCEKELNTQAKTGVFGQVKPANFKSFIIFATEVFRLLHKTGRASLVTEPGILVPADRILIIETYPHTAWRKLGMPPLPSKRCCSREQLARHAEQLKRLCGLPEVKNPTHDELSALVSGLAGVAIAARNEAGYIVAGMPPKVSPQGHVLEGYIVNPRRG